MATAETTPVTAIPLSELEKRIWLDIEWAQQNAEVQERFAGEWVAIHLRNVVAHGKDRDQVLNEAATTLRRPVEELAVWPISAPTSVLSDSPQPSPEF
jgi:hypothetical protein